MPLVSILVSNDLVKIVPDLNQPLFQLINTVDVCMKNNFFHTW